LGAVWLWATDKHVGVQLVREPRTSIMAAVRHIVDYLPDLGLLRAYSASQRLISITSDRQKIIWQPSATQLSRASGSGKLKRIDNG